MTEYGVLDGGWVVPGIALPGTHPHRTTPGTPPRTVLAASAVPAAVPGLEYGRGALFRRPTHFKGPFLRHKGYDRGS